MAGANPYIMQDPSYVPELASGTMKFLDGLGGKAFTPPQVDPGPADGTTVDQGGLHDRRANALVRGLGMLQEATARPNQPFPTPPAPLIRPFLRPEQLQFLRDSRTQSPIAELLGIGAL